VQASLFKKSAVLIEKNSLHCMLYEDVLEANGFDVYVARSAMDGLIKIKETKQDITVINTEIAEESFVEKLITKMKTERASQHMPIIGLSVYSPECKKNIAKTLDAFLTKPISIDKLTESIFACIEGRKYGSSSFDNQ
jgi:DNA-binding response OmpR family regulator